MSDDHEVRELRFRLKQANKTMGRQGQTIRSLRGELAVTRLEHSKIERGDIRSLERQVESLTADLEKTRQENKKLREDRDSRGHKQAREETSA